MQPYDWAIVAAAALVVVFSVLAGLALDRRDEAGGSWRPVLVRAAAVATCALVAADGSAADGAALAIVAMGVALASAFARYATRMLRIDG